MSDRITLCEWTARLHAACVTVTEHHNGVTTIVSGDGWGADVRSSDGSTIVHVGLSPIACGGGVHTLAARVRVEMSTALPAHIARAEERATSALKAVRAGEMLWRLVRDLIVDARL